MCAAQSHGLAMEGLQISYSYFTSCATRLQRTSELFILGWLMIESIPVGISTASSKTSARDLLAHITTINS